jgi:hypothetical protein
MRTASTWPLDFFILNCDANGYLHAREDTKAWWAIQKLTGFHCHHRKFHNAAKQIPAPDPATFDDMEIDDNFILPSSETSKKCKSQNENQMDIDTSNPAMNTTPPPKPPAATPSPSPNPTAE